MDPIKFNKLVKIVAAQQKIINKLAAQNKNLNKKASKDTNVVDFDSLSARQSKINALIDKLAQQLNPGQTAVDFDAGGDRTKTHNTVGDLKDPNKHVADEKTAIISYLNPSQQKAIKSLTVEGNTVKVQFNVGMGTDEIFDALLKAVEKAIPYKNMSVREIAS